MMEAQTVARLLELMAAAPGLETVDITGGAPELNPHFRDLVLGVRALGLRVIDRCNLTVLFEPGQEDTAEFLQSNHIHIIASLPCYLGENVEKQRGLGVFDKSIAALRKLNELGYAQPDSALQLDLVYNPQGPHLPPPQAGLEQDYKRELRARYGVAFNRLYTITNMPIKRFLHDLEREQKYDIYMELLINAFNPETALGVMCRDLVSIGWDGQIYDCDFNQMLELPLGGKARTIWDIDNLDELNSENIAFDQHCFGCTAGAGSSCGGTLT
jgi:radical SAM/Cys-rich protein